MRREYPGMSSAKAILCTLALLVGVAVINVLLCLYPKATLTTLAFIIILEIFYPRKEDKNVSNL
jgi:hypothetical protein